MGKRIVGIYIMEVLSKYTSKSKPMLQGEIVKILDNEYGITITRRTIQEYIKLLREEGYIEGTKGVYRNNEFSDMELRLLIDGIFFSKHIPEDAAINLINKLKGLSNNGLKNQILHVHYLKDMHRMENENLYEIIDRLDDAIGMNRKVEITNYTYSIHGDRVETGKRIISPYYIVTSKTQYYLICYAGRDGDVENRRIDRMSHVKVLNEQALKVAELEKYKYNPFDLAEYMNEHIYMFSGESARITLKVKRNMIGDVIDWFGKSYNIIDEQEDYAIIKLKANLQGTYYWALQYGANIEVLKPESLRERLRAGLEEILKKYTNES